MMTETLIESLAGSFAKPLSDVEEEMIFTDEIWHILENLVSSGLDILAQVSDGG